MTMPSCRPALALPSFQSRRKRAALARRMSSGSRKLDCLSRDTYGLKVPGYHFWAGRSAPCIIPPA